jgi:vacuolar iron transporter family protein
VAIDSAKDEITDHTVYKRMSALGLERNAEFRKVLADLAEMEYRHYEFWMKYVPPPKNKNIKASAIRVYLTILLRIILGTTFASKYL